MPIAADTAEMIVDGSFNVAHRFEANALESADSASNRQRSRRLAQESATWSHSLPLSPSSTIFVRCDIARMDVLKVLIVGPADTPYANGCFVFDVHLPGDYPNVPPLISLETTGGGRVQFNPNLYDNGGVCLSVLNTWFGGPDEMWKPQTSSLLQVLVSIQSLILVPEPFFNEPGNERMRGTAEGTQLSNAYNHVTACNTFLWAIQSQLRSCCPVFGDVIRTHFYLKRKEICQQLQEWLKTLNSDTVVVDGDYSVAKMKEVRNSLKQLRKELYGLPKPATW